MRSERGNGRGPKGQSASSGSLEQIEYLLEQSSQGVHFIFDHCDVAKVLKVPAEDKKFFNADNMKKAQGLLSSFLECPSLQERRSFLDRLPAGDFELLIRAYFHLVENTILAHSNVRH